MGYMVRKRGWVNGEEGWGYMVRKEKDGLHGKEREGWVTW